MIRRKTTCLVERKAKTLISIVIGNREPKCLPSFLRRLISSCIDANNHCTHLKHTVILVTNISIRISGPKTVINCAPSTQPAVFILDS